MLTRKLCEASACVVLAAVRPRNSYESSVCLFASSKMCSQNVLSIKECVGLLKFCLLLRPCPWFLCYLPFAAWNLVRKQARQLRQREPLLPRRHLCLVSGDASYSACDGVTVRKWGTAAYLVQCGSGIAECKSPNKSYSELKVG